MESKLIEYAQLPRVTNHRIKGCLSGGNGSNRNTIFAVHGCGAVIPLKDNWRAHVKGNPVRDSRECAILIDG